MADRVIQTLPNNSLQDIWQEEVLKDHLITFCVDRIDVPGCGGISNGADFGLSMPPSRRSDSLLIYDYTEILNLKPDLNISCRKWF